MAMTDRHDYKREWENFKNAQTHPDLALTQKGYAEALGIGEMALSRHFTVFRQQEEDEEIRQTFRRIAKNGNNKVAKFIDEFTPTDIKDAETLAKIGNGAADRIGFSPQAATINVNQQNVQALVIPPLFASEEAQNLKTMMGE